MTAAALDELKDAVAVLREEYDRAKAALDAAEEELMAKRFEGYDLYEVGTVVQVRRNMMGSFRWWPARVLGVNLHYQEGTDADGKPWVSQSVSYSVTLWVKKEHAFAGFQCRLLGQEMTAFTGDLAELAEG